MYIKVRVTAGSKKEEVAQKAADHFTVWVKEPAELNLANNRVRTLMARQFGVLVGKVKIISGHHSPSKILSISIPE